MFCTLNSIWLRQTNFLSIFSTCCAEGCSIECDQCWLMLILPEPFTFDNISPISSSVSVSPSRTVAYEMDKNLESWTLKKDCHGLRTMLFTLFWYHGLFLGILDKHVNERATGCLYQQKISYFVTSTFKVDQYRILESGKRLLPFHDKLL